jgi:CRISPR-associated protein Csd1
MLLKALVEFWEEYKRDHPRECAPKMYGDLPIKWIVDLDSDGSFMGVVRASGEESGKKDRGKIMFAPHALKTSGVCARLLADNGEYALGIARENETKKDEKVEERHATFVDAVKKCAAATNESAVKAVVGFLESGKLPIEEVPEDFNAQDNVTFRVAGVLPIMLKSVREYWADKGAPTDGRQMQCLVCQQVKLCPESHPFQIKGIRGGNPTGMALSSANAKAFESYGLDRSLVAPTCIECGESFVKGLNKLLELDANHISTGPISYIFWVKGGDFSPAPYLRDADATEVRALLEAAWKGHAGAANISDAPFYAAALTANNARVVVRSWIETTVTSAKRNLARYFDLQRIVEPDGSEWRPLTLFALAVSTVRDAKDLPERTVRHLLDAALNGGPLPLDLLYQAVRRNRAEQQVTRSRAALIKIVLLSQIPKWKEGDDMVELNEAERSPAYLCGRLLAVLENLQHAAIPGVEAGVVERFYGAASATPAAVFPTLMRKAQAHLSKLRTTSPPVYNALQQRMEEITDGLPDFPNTLTLKEQGRFCLGYYHQRSNDRAQARERKEAKAAKAAAAE